MKYTQYIIRFRIYKNKYNYEIYKDIGYRQLFILLQALLKRKNMECIKIGENVFILTIFH